MSRLVIASNRIAPPDNTTSKTGGLAVALLAALEKSGGVWFGWSGKVTASSDRRPKVTTVGKLTYATTDLTHADYEDYYNGFSNRTLWPLFHYRMDLTGYSRKNFAGYLRVNQQFARQLFPLLKPDDTIWIHDYHLIPLGNELRRSGATQRMGFFLHTPFPNPEVLRSLPRCEMIVRALCAYDLVGFQTERDLRAFCDFIRYEVGGKILKNGEVEAFGRKLRAQFFPISIDTDDIVKMAEKAERSRQSQRLKSSLRDRSMMIGVDRLDYSKGLPRRFEAFERLLESYPSNRGRVTLMQIAPPSRSEVPEYNEIRQQLETRSGHINGRFAEFDWVPIRYLNKSFNRRVLAGFYRLSDVGLVTPLRDGMNLVAKEFVAAQKPSDPGVLVLSQFAGAAAELDGAMIVNPYDIDEIAEAMETALEMPKEERRERWKQMMEPLRKNDVTAWRKRFLDTLGNTTSAAL